MLDTPLLECGAHSITLTPAGEVLVTGFFKEHQLQAKSAGEFDGASSLTASLEGNLGSALLATSSPIDRGRRQRLTTRPPAQEPICDGSKMRDWAHCVSQ